MKFLAALALLFATPALATTVTVTPATFVAAISAATPGEIIKLTDGDYGDVYIRGGAKTYSPRLTVDACGSKAVFKNLRFDGRSGLVLDCLTFDGGGLVLKYDSDVAVTALKSTGPAIAGVVATNLSNGSFADIDVVGSVSDGFDCGGCQHVTVTRLACHGFVPGPGAHPDCAQICSPKGVRATVDIRLDNSISEGPNQGFDMFGNDGLPATDVVFDKLTVATTSTWAFAMGNCTMTATGKPCAVTNSQGHALPGSRYGIHMEWKVPGDTNTGSRWPK